jgi:pimeloyl-ACP methyl ester carboxylesterase
MKTKPLILLLCLFICACADRKLAPITQAGIVKDENKDVITDTLSFFDTARKRLIPLAFYRTASSTKQPVAIINHGYAGANRGYTYKAYSYIANNLARNGYFVVSIQHDLAGDPEMPATGNIQLVRKPFWERGSQSIGFVINQLKSRYTNLDLSNITLIGHSNGGDMVMLFAYEHPELISNVISLDNRRVAFPRTNRPRIFSIRSSDQKPDPGVLPTEAEQKKFNMKIVGLKHTIHNDMGDSGTDKQKAEINDYIMDFLQIKP